MDGGCGALLLLSQRALNTGVAAGLVVEAVELDVFKLQGELIVLRNLILLLQLFSLVLGWELLSLL